MRKFKYILRRTLPICILIVPLLADAQYLQNPTQFPTIQRFIEGVLRAVVYIATPIIALFMVYAGFLFVKARGNESELSNAKKNFLYVVMGAILILGAWVFATLIGGTVSQLLG